MIFRFREEVTAAISAEAVAKTWVDVCGTSTCCLSGCSTSGAFRSDALPPEELGRGGLDVGIVGEEDVDEEVSPGVIGVRVHSELSESGLWSTSSSDDSSCDSSKTMPIAFCSGNLLLLRIGLASHSCLITIAGLDKGDSPKEVSTEGIGS